jgi:endo-1,4-beta-xylanase
VGGGNIMRKLSLITLLGIWLLNACTSPVPTPSAVVSTAILTNTPIPTITPTPKPSAMVNKATSLYRGPGNIDYEVLADIAAGERVYPTGTFGDFVQVEYQAQIGFVVKTAFEQLPEHLNELLESNVPPQSENLLELMYDSETRWSDGYATIDRANNDQWWGYDIGTIPLTKPFTVEIDMTQKGQYGAIVLSGRIPAPGKQFWEGRHTLYIVADGSIEIRDGQSENSIYRQNIDGIRGQPFSVIFPDPHGKSVIFQSQSGKELANIDFTSLQGMILSNGLFPDGVLYFGALVAPSSSLTIKRLDLCHSPNGSFQEQQEYVMGLRDLANQKNILIGADIDVRVFNVLQLRDKATSEFNGVTIGFPWAEIEPERGKFDFSKTDQMVEFAAQNNMKIMGLHLLWGSRDHLPNWLLEGNFTQDELKEILHQYVVTLANRYKGKIYIWSIANEFTARRLWGGDFWYDRLGSAYVESAFRWAHETDPNALLMLNEAGNESMASTNAIIVSRMLSFVEQLKNDSVPIDAIGMQMHLLSPFSIKEVPAKQDVMETMLKFSNLGFPVYVTEIDVNLHNVQGNQQEKWDYQANVYKEMFEACLESGVCKGFFIFGISDAFSWYNECDLCLNIPDAEPLIFDEYFNPKPAYYALVEVLQQIAP